MTLHRLSSNCLFSNDITKRPVARAGGIALALCIGMTGNQRPVVCHIASIINSSLDRQLEKFGFCHGLIVFAIPEYGILFRCRAEGDPIRLEFGAFFSCLRFIKTTLADAKIKNVDICSSNPEFVASFAAGSKYLSEGSERESMLREYAREMQISIQFLSRLHNRCLASPADYPSTPVGQQPILTPGRAKQQVVEIKPFQKGIKL